MEVESDNKSIYDCDQVNWKHGYEDNTSGSVAPPPGQGGGYGVWVGVAYSWSLLEQAALSAVTLSPWLYFASRR